MIIQKLAIKWSLIMAVLLAMGLTILFIFTSSVIWRTASERTQEKFEKGFVRLEAIFERILQENLERALFLSQDEGKLVEPLGQGNYEQLRANLAVELKKRVAINLILVTDDRGQVVARAPEGPEAKSLQEADLTDFINRALRGEIIREILVSSSDFVLAVLVPVKTGAQTLGVCLLGSRVAEQTMKSYSQISGLGLGIYFRGAKVLSAYEGLDRLPNTYSPGAFQTLWIGREKFDVAFSPAENFHSQGSWTLAGILPYAERETLVRKEQTLLLTLITGAGLTLVGLIFLGIRGLVRPILRLTEVSRAIARDEWNVAVPGTHRKDEIGELARSFEHMILQRRQVEESLVEQTREMHHRVKNNLQMIHSLLQLQLRRKNLLDPEALVRSTLSRIQSIALTHEFLSRQERGPLRILDLLKRIGESSRNTLARPNQKVEISVTGQDILVSPASALPLAFITHELVVNAIKHGFKNRETGRIQISLSLENSQIALQITDDGQGIPEERLASADFYNLGLQLVQRFVSRDLKGHFHLANNALRGTTARITFEPFNLNL